jgi:hypothetical protein
MMNGTKSQNAAPTAITAETRAAFDRMRARTRIEAETLAAFDGMRQQIAIERREVRRIAALCTVVLRQCDEIAAIRAWREVAALTRDPFAWSSGARELPS